jgi:hypothetical protein
VFVNRVRKGIFGLQRHEIIGGQGKCKSQELHNLYSLLNIIKMMNIKKDWIGWVHSTHGRDVHMEF